MARSRHCDACKGWHDLNEPWPTKCLGHFKRLDESNTRSAHVMGDIEPYRAVTGEIIRGRKQHKDFLKARGVVEVGNEVINKTYEPPPPPREDIKRAIEEHGGLRH